MMPDGCEREVLAHKITQLSILDLAAALRVDSDTHRLAHTDGISQLHFAAISQTCSHDVLGHITRHVGG